MSRLFSKLFAPNAVVTNEVQTISENIKEPTTVEIVEKKEKNHKATLSSTTKKTRSKKQSTGHTKSGVRVVTYSKFNRYMYKEIKDLPIVVSKYGKKASFLVIPYTGSMENVPKYVKVGNGQSADNGNYKLNFFKNLIGRLYA